MSRWTKRPEAEKHEMYLEKKEKEKSNNRAVKMLRDHDRYQGLILRGEIPMICPRCMGTTYSEKYEIVKGKDVINPLVKDETPVICGKCTKCGHPIQTFIDAFDVMSMGILLSIDKLKESGRLVDKRESK